MPWGAAARLWRTACGQRPGDGQVVVLDQHARAEVGPVVRAAARPDRQLSSARAPGKVLRVSAMRARLPAIAFTKARVRVAIPDRRCRKFSAVRSARSRPRAEPRPGAGLAPAADLVAVARVRSRCGCRRPRAGTPRPPRRVRPPPPARGRRCSPTPRSSGPTVASVVTSPRPRSSSRARSISRVHRGRQPLDRHAIAAQLISRPTAGVRSEHRGLGQQARHPVVHGPAARCFAVRLSRGSGFTTTRLFTRSSMGRSVYESV